MGTLVCTICLDKDKGGTVIIENADGKITQTLRMDGTSVVIEVKGDSSTSTYTQTADGVAIHCKTFQLSAETITCKSTGATHHESDDAFSVESSKDLKLTSNANLAAKAATDLTAQATNVKLTADSEFCAAGMGASYKAASTTATVQGATVKLNGSAELKAEAPMIELSASATLKAESSGLCQVKGSLTSVG